MCIMGATVTVDAVAIIAAAVAAAVVVIVAAVVGCRHLAAAILGEKTRDALSIATLPVIER